MKNNKFSLKKRLQSFKYAFNGLRVLIKEEHNSRIHLVAMLIVIAVGFLFNVKSYEWISIVLSIGIVIAFELINSAIENLADFITSDKHELIKKSKDLAAAGVFCSSIAACIVGLIIFVPRILELLK